MKALLFFNTSKKLWETKGHMNWVFKGLVGA